MPPSINARRQLYSLTLPIFIEILLVMLLGVTDTVMLSLRSDEAVAAVGVVNQLLNMVFLLFGVSTTGTSVLCSQYFGAGQQKNVIQVVGVSLFFNCVVGLSVSAALCAGASPILRLMDLRVELLDDATVYMRIVGGFAFLQAVSLTLSAVLRSADMAYYPMQVTLLINIINMIGNYLLIFGKCGFPELGVEGAAVATAFSRSIAVLLLSFILFRKSMRHVPLAWFRPFPVDKLGRMLRIGLPSAGEQLSYSLSQVVITYFTNILGNDALAARTYVMNIVMFSYLFALSVGQGGAICIGYLVGRHENKAAFLLGRYCMRLAMLISFCTAALTAVGGPFILRLLTSNPDILHMATLVLMVDVLLEVGRSVNIFATNALRAAGDATYPFVVGLIVMWSVATGLGYVFGITLGGGLVGTWVAFTCDESLRAFILGRRWHSRRWEKMGFVN